MQPSGEEEEEVMLSPRKKRSGRASDGDDVETIKDWQKRIAVPPPPLPVYGPSPGPPADPPPAEPPAPTVFPTFLPPDDDVLPPSEKSW